MRVSAIGFRNSTGKLVFVALTPNYLSLRDQSADWSWQSPGPMEPGNDYRQNPIDSHFPWNYSLHFRSNRGIATSLRSSQ